MRSLKNTFHNVNKCYVHILIWIPSKSPSQLIQRLVENLDLELDEQGYVKTNEMQQTNVKGLFAAGDLQGSMGALAAAYDGGWQLDLYLHLGCWNTQVEGWLRES